MEGSTLSSNWKQLQAKLRAEKASTSTTGAASSSPHTTKRKRSDPVHRETPSAPPTKKRARRDDPLTTTQKRPVPTHKSKAGANAKMNISNSTSNRSAPPTTPTTAPAINAGLTPSSLPLGKYIALDCEMVGTGPSSPPSAQISVLARVSLVTYHGDQVYDSYVLPLPSQLPITDYRTAVSGITPACMKVARPFADVQRQVRALLQGRVLVGHSVQNDLKVLGLVGEVDRRDVRDTARFGRYRDEVAGGGWPRLRDLAGRYLGLGAGEGFQRGEHSSVEDARVTMMLFRREKEGIEREVRGRYGVGRGGRGRAMPVTKTSEAVNGDDVHGKGRVNGMMVENGDAGENDDDGEGVYESDTGEGGSQQTTTAAPKKKKSKKKKKRRK